MESMTPEQAAEIFPAECHFKIVVAASDGVAGRLNQVLDAYQREERVCLGNRSAGGKYVTYNVSLVVENLELMREMDCAFRAVEGVRMVL